MSLSHTLAHLFHPRHSNNHRPRVLHAAAYPWYAALVVAVGIGLKLVAYSHVPMGDVLGFASSITAAQVVEETNQRRATQGLAPLVVNSQLSAAAAQKAADMFAKQYWAHTSPEGTEPWYFFRQSGYKYQAAGENLARDFGSTQPMVQAWMDSPTHRANIVNSRYTEIGVAVVDGTLQGVETTLVVQLFGRPAAATAQVSPTAQQQEVAGAANPVLEAVPVAAVPPTVVPEAPEPSPAVVILTNEPATQALQAAPAATPVVLAQVLFNQGRLTRPPLFSPLQLSKIFFLSIIMLLVLTLVYDSLVIGHRQTMRLVGHNLGHVLFMITVAFVVILFKGGLVH